MFIGNIYQILQKTKENPTEQYQSWDIFISNIEHDLNGRQINSSQRDRISLKNINEEICVITKTNGTNSM